MTDKINHIGIAVKNLDTSIPFYRDILKMQLETVEEVADQKVRVAMFICGESRIELLEATSEDSPIARFLEKNGEGIHHIAYQVTGLDTKLKELKESGVRLVDETPRPGAHGTRIAFLHPKSSGSVLTELCEEGH
ncbi:methylmalonyl-CoA epimerase [Desulfurispirillum indicum]|uniref:Methylmalonyl-CoA epimerase n=1 Tax=Desulfurispirillum indicum (strain ATCC BAA-1389 / DSM 22839 / S5) TaxID=653733 RepID=E6W6P6_DESIS|nr:methylmalonyl-CoA epimerase [Desulfurispirillum indicum]ADU65046.1 methylmalonyl-CoA epimerase [Desulfurispirillum indicum S5]UCZ56954.1 methylmalonyl-CoA epimerase [Desulfurispirillum indicum]